MQPLFRFLFSLRLTLLVLLITVSVGLSFAILSAPTVQAQGESPPYDPADVTVPLAPPFAAAGRASYATNCAPCHGEQGLGDGPTAAELPGPPTAFADPTVVWDQSPGMLFHTTKFGRLQALMPPWSNRLNDSEIWDTVAFAWSLHTSAAETEAGATLYGASCANCHGDSGRGDGPNAEGQLPDFTDLSSVIFMSQADWLAGWQSAHPEVGADWTEAEQQNTLEYIRTFSYTPPWESAYRPGAGVLTGQIVQGTPGGPDISGLEVVLNAYLGFDPIATFTTTVSTDGKFVFEDLAVGENIAYLASIVHDGISYSSNFIVLSPEESSGTTEIGVYEGTDDPSNIRINRTHWIVDSQPGALILGQIYTYGNTGDRTYLGEMLEGADELVTVGLRLPAGAEEISFENGVLGDRFLQVGDTIYDTMPVVPGEDTRQIIVRYALPYNGTSVDITQDFLYPVDQLSLLVADLPNLSIDVADMESGGTQDIQGRSYQIWSKGSFEPDTIEISMQGLLEAGSVDPRAVEAEAAAAGAQGLTTILPPMESWATWVMAALVAAALIALLGIALQRGTLNMRYTRQDLSALRESLVVEIARLDDLHAMGEISDSEWLQQRSQLKAQLMDVIRRLNRGRAREA